MKIKLFVFLFFSNILNAQISKDFIPLNSITPNKSIADLQAMDNYFEGKKIIGIGESTHGSSEFTTMRHRIFKYLVEEKGYTVFFLEADVSACRRVNRYIHGAEDSVNSAVKEFALWPWLTEEMVTLVEWCRKYNETAESKIEFVGCDMQLITDEKLELPLYFQNLEQQKNLMEIFADLNSEHTSKEIAKERYEKWISFVASNVEEEKLNSSEFKLIKKSIDQWFEFKLAGKYNYNFRDSCMAENMIYYQQLHPETKAMFFAHNWHVSKYIHSYKSGVPSMKTAGRYLNERMGENYLSLAMVTNEGQLNARSYDNRQNGYYVFDLKPSKKRSIEHELSKFNVPILFYEVKQGDELNELKHTEIGAVYGRKKYGIKYPRYNQLQNGSYDGFFYIEKTTPTKLLK